MQINCGKAKSGDTVERTGFRYLCVSIIINNTIKRFAENVIIWYWRTSRGAAELDLDENYPALCDKLE